jgi:hypothetical protein
VALTKPLEINMTVNPKTLGLINALLANGTNPTPRPLGLGGLSSLHAQPGTQGALSQIFARSEHDRIVEKLRSRLVSGMYSNIRVDLPGYVKPERIIWTHTQRGHEPDTTAYYGVKQHVFEVETAETLGVEHTYEQCRLFAAYVRNRFAEFTLVVPGGSGFDARLQLIRWGLNASVLEIE